MGISERERRIREFNGSIKYQLRLIRKLEKRGKDLTSAQIVLDSLRASLFLATQDWHRVQCDAGPDQIGNDVNRASSAAEPSPSLIIFPHGERHMARRTGGETLMKARKDLLGIFNKGDTKEMTEQVSTSIVPDIAAEKENNSSERDGGFRPLSEVEKNEFLNSLSADGRRILAQLAGEAKIHKGESAA